MCFKWPLPQGHAVPFPFHLFLHSAFSTRQSCTKLFLCLLCACPLKVRSLNGSVYSQLTSLMLCANICHCARARKMRWWEADFHRVFNFGASVGQGSATELWAGASKWSKAGLDCGSGPSGVRTAAVTTNSTVTVAWPLPLWKSTGFSAAVYASWLCA